MTFLQYSKQVYISFKIAGKNEILPHTCHIKTKQFFFNLIDIFPSKPEGKKKTTNVRHDNRNKMRKCCHKYNS